MTILMHFAKHFHSSESTDLILLALQGMTDSTNYNTEVASHLMVVLMDCYSPMPSDVQRIVMAIHRNRKLITNELGLWKIRTALPWLAAASPRAVTVTLLRCSPTCDTDTWELWEYVLSSVDMFPKMLQQLLQVLEILPPELETEIGNLSMAAAKVLYELLQCMDYGPQVRLFFVELFVALIIQLVSCKMPDPQEVMAIRDGPFLLSVPASAARTMVEAGRSFLLCTNMANLASSMEIHGLWLQLLGPTWKKGLSALARLMVNKCPGQCHRIISHLQKLLLYHQLEWREVPVLAFFIELWSCQRQHEDDEHTQKIFRKHIRSTQPRSRELAMHGLRALYAGRLQLLLPDALLWLQDVRADVILQGLHLLQDIAAQHPASIQDVLLQLATWLLPRFNEDNAEVRWRSMELFALLLKSPGRRWLLPQAERSLLLLLMHVNEDIPKVAQAAQKALLRAAKLLGWQQRQHLASTAEVWMIADWLLQRRSRDVELYLKQAVLHLSSTQVPVRETAVRVLGKLGQVLMKESQQKALDVCEALQGAKDDSDPAVRCLVQQTLLILSSM